MRLSVRRISTVVEFAVHKFYKLKISAFQDRPQDVFGEFLQGIFGYNIVSTVGQ